MNHRERFLRLFHFKDVDRFPDYEFGYWSETIDRWHREGLPLEKKSIRDVTHYFGFDGFPSIFFPLEILPIRCGLWPTLPERILKREGDRETVDDGMGGIYTRAVNTSTPPHYIRYPISKKEDWERIRSLFDPDTPGRFPLNWNETVESYEERDYPLGIRVGSLYGWLRNLMGVERISIAFYRDPSWVSDMMDTLVDLWIKVIRTTLGPIKLDFAQWWEDMCYSKGPLLSVHHFEEFMVPRYRKVTNILKEYGVEINAIDSDGDITSLIPGWIKAGINCFFPIEVRFTDIYKIREKFGRKILMMGGLNKFSLMKGRTSINNELERLNPLLQESGYIPMVDHYVPPEVSLADYQYYLHKKRKWIGKND